MNKISFLEVPQCYQNQIIRISEGTIQNIFSKFNIKYFPFETIKKQYIINNKPHKKSYFINTIKYHNKNFNSNIDEDQPLLDFLFNYLKNNRLIIYEIKKNDINKDLENNNLINFIVCFEDECVIIEEISENSIKNIIMQLKQKQITLINIGIQTIFHNNSAKTTTKEKDANLITKEKEDTAKKDAIYLTPNEEKDEYNAREEVQNFCSVFYDKQKNSVVKYLLPVMIGYLIRRYYCKSEDFKDPSFFIFDNSKKSKELNLVTKIKDFLIPNKKFAAFKIKINKEESISQLKSISEEIHTLNTDYKKAQNEVFEFKKEDFVILRNLHTSEGALFFLVIHLKTLYVFVLKKVEQVNKREIDFCKNYTHRCMTKFYGFLKEGKNIVGFIYEFQSNGSLSAYYNYIYGRQQNEQENKLFTIISICRLFEFIEFLYSNSLIHRDLKPLNILVNHDHLPFISDFETIRTITDGQADNPTFNIETATYSSPEQDTNGKISFPTDIYSFGLIVYYLKEKKHLITSFLDKEKLIQKPITNCSEYIQQLYKNCVVYEQDKRLRNNEIENLLNEELKSFYYFEEYLLNKANNKSHSNISQIIEFMIEKFLIGQPKEQPSSLFDQILIFQDFLLGSNSKLLFYKLGAIYEKGYIIEQNMTKAKNYYEQSSNFNKFYVLNKHLNSDKMNHFHNKDANSKKSIQLKNPNLLKNLPIHLEDFQNRKNEKEYHKQSLNFYENTERDNQVCFNEQLSSKGAKQDHSKIIDYYEQLAKLNNSDALIQLGLFYEDGIGCKQDYLKALEYYERSSKLNNSDAFCKLGSFYEHGLGVKQDYQKAIEYYEQSSKSNNSYAIYFLGLLHEEGRGVKQDYSKAIEYYEKSSRLNNSDAIYQLGFLYEKGKGFNQDYSKAIEYYERSSKLNNSSAFFKLGKFYEKGIGVEQDYSKAIKYYEKSSKLNNSDALILLGLMYEDGRGVKQNYTKAMNYYERSSKLSNSEALIILGSMYEDGRGVKQDYSKAMNYYERSSKLNNSDAFVKLGKFYEIGRGVKQDYLKAIEYYEKSSKLNNSDAFFNLGSLYENGQGVKKDYLKAIKHYERSSTLNNSAALTHLGKIYEYGQGVAIDYLRSKYYYEQASKLGDSYAHFFLGELYAKGKGVEQNYKKAIEYYELSSKQDNPDALYKLGTIYEQGLGVKIDYSKAKEYYERSSYFNDSYSFFKLGQFYEYGYGVEKDYIKAKYYYEISSKLDNPKAHFILGVLYSTGEYIDVNITKSIKYFLQSIKIQRRIICNKNNLNHLESYTFEPNNMRYISYNHLGLIYHIVLDDIEKAELYIKKSAFDEYPFGQNNFGLINQFYINNIENAEYMFGRSSKHKFSLAEYNLGHLLEINNKRNESIQYYIRASEHVNEPLIYRGIYFFDKRLEISKAFIICFTNLKLTEHYFSLSEYDESKKYFIKSINFYDSFEETSSYKFRFSFKKEFYDDYYSCNLFSYIKKFILNFPLFNLINQPNLPNSIQIYLHSVSYNFEYEINKEKEISYQFKSTTNEPNKKYAKDICYSENKNALKEFFEKQSYIEQIDKQERNKNTFSYKKDEYQKEKQNLDEIVFDDPGSLFDFIIMDSKSKSKSKPEFDTDMTLKTIFIKEIKEIICIMNEILYTKPYSILFGRISIEKPKKQTPDKKNDIDRHFYSGFGIS